MARLLVTNQAGTHTAHITDTDDGYQWECTCDQQDQTRRQADAIEYASQHVDQH